MVNEVINPLLLERYSNIKIPHLKIKFCMVMLLKGRSVQDLATSSGEDADCRTN